MDPISDMLTIIRNGYLARKLRVDFPYSKAKEALAHVLHAEGFVGRPTVSGRTPAEKRLAFDLVYRRRQPAVVGLKRISKPGARRYFRSDKLPRVRLGFGATIVSTSKGVMTDKEAKKHNLGGEVICQIW